MRQSSMRHQLVGRAARSAGPGGPGGRSPPGKIDDLRQPPRKIDDFPATVYTFPSAARSRGKPVTGKPMISPQLYTLLVHAHFPEGRGNKCPHRRLMGKQLRSARAEISPLVFFSLHPVHPFPPGDAGRPRRGNNNNNNTTTRWRCPWVPCHPSRPGSFH